VFIAGVFPSCRQQGSPELVVGVYSNGSAKELLHFFKTCLALTAIILLSILSSHTQPTIISQMFALSWRTAKFELIYK
jgi:hypothetical protein